MLQRYNKILRLSIAYLQLLDYQPVNFQNTYFLLFLLFGLFAKTWHYISIFAKIMKKVKKMATEIEVQERTAYLQDLLVRGGRKGVAIANFMEKYSLCKRSAEIYINKAYAAFANQNKQKIAGRKALHCEMRRDLLFDAIAQNKEKFDAYTGSFILSLLKDLGKIEGVYEPPQKEDSLSTGVLTALGNLTQKLELGNISKETFTELCFLWKVPKDNIDRILAAVKAAEDNMEGYDVDSGLIRKYVK